MAFLVRVLVANVAMVTCLEYLDRPLDWWLAASVWSRSVWLGTVVCVGAFVYFVTLVIAGGRPSQLGHRSG
jgi:peptidoglycan biosynthesis protein MviN/MurJ (putative lipid II flippase)